MKKRLLSLLLALVMLLGLLPTAAMAAETEEAPMGEETVTAPAAEEAPDAPVRAQTLAADDATTQWLGSHPLWVGSTEVTGDNADNILGDNTASFAVEDGVPVLTLNGVTITEGTNEHYVAAGGAVGICSHASLTIRLAQGTTNTVNVEGTSKSYGILAYQGSLTITGKGTLTASAHMTTSDSNCVGINAGGAGLSIEGGAAVTALGDTGAQAAAHLTVKDGATLAVGGTRYAVEVGTGFVLPEDYAVLGGASADALQVARTGQMPHSDYYIFVGEENTEDNVAKYAVIVQHPITQQPAKGNGYTVIAPDAGGYQWYTAKEIAKTVVGGTNEDTDTTAAVGTQWGEYSENNQRWSADEYGDYFEIALAGGDKLTVTFPDGDMPTSGGLYLTEVGGRGNSWSHFFGTPSSDSFTVKDTAITCAIPAGVNGIFTLSIRGLSNNADPPAIQAARTRLVPVQAVDGQTTATLTTTQSGTYLCQVSWPDGFTLNSDPVDYLAPSHSHPVCGAACAHEGADAHEAVAFTSALSGDADGKLYIDGTEATLDAEASLKYVLPAGNYYLDGDIALGKPITTLEGETVNLCFNGHTITYANDEDNRSGVFTAEGIFNACDCQGGGGITDARTFPNGNLKFLMYVRSSCALYGGEYIGADGSDYGGKTIYSRGRLTVDGATITGSFYAILQENYSTMTIKSGTMTGPVSVNSTRTNFVMEGGTIVNEGGGALSAGGGTIRGGTVQGKLGLLVERATQPVILSGKPTVKGSESDIYFPYPGTNSALIQVSDDLEGVYTLSGSASAITADAPFTFTTPADKDYSAHFVPADTSQGIRDVVDEATGKHTLQLYKAHSHAMSVDCSTTEGDQVTFTAWDAADSLPTTAGNYVLTGDVTLSNAWTVPQGVTNLCLGGHTIQRATGGSQNPITIPSGSALHICECSENKTGTINGYGGTWTISVLGTLSLYGGTVTYGSIGVNVSHGGVFQMHGGQVKGITGTGVQVRENCTFLMDGGTITGNSTGVLVEADGVFRAEGNVVIDGNGRDGDASNVVMQTTYEGQTVVPVPMELSGPLGANAKIGLSLYAWENMEEVSPYLAVQGAGGYTVTADDFAKLSSDKAEDYPLKLTNGKVYFTVPQTHSHPVCGETCGHEGDETHEAVTYTALTQDVVDGYEVQHHYATDMGGTSYEYITIPAGRYYLEEDITTDKVVKLGGNVDLCFNGCTFTSTFGDTSYRLGALMLSDNAVFNACDCQGGGGFTSDGEYGLVTDRNEGVNCTVNLYGGTFTGGYPVELGSSADTTLTVDGAALTATKGNALGATGGKVTIKSGQITSQYDYGGAVDVRCDDFTLTGGTITNTGKGPALTILALEPVKLSGSPVIQGGEQGDISLTYATCKLAVGADLTGTYRVAAGSTVREDTPWVITAPADADQSGHFTLPDTDAYKTRQLKDVVDEATGKHTLQLIQNHAWATTWTSDATAHWHECTADGCTITANADKDGYAAHTPGSWQTDAANHWKVCTVCGYELDKAAHVYDDDQDTTCNTCGYTRTVTSEHTHAWAAGWSKDDTHHWHECTAAGCTITANADKDGYAAHTWNDGEVTTPPTASNEGVKTYTCTVCQATRTESVPKLTFGVSGIVTDHEGSELAGVTVTLMQGNTVITTATTDSQGNYSFEDVPAGLYNVAAEKDGVTKTVLVEVTDASATEQNIQMPEGNKNSVVEIKENTPAAVVGGVDAVAEAETVAPGDTVTVKLTVEAKETPTDKDELEAVIVGKKDDVLYLDLSLVKQVNDRTPEAIIDTGDKVLEIVVPYDFAGKKDVTVYRKHGSDPAAALDKADTKADGTYRLDEAEGKVYIYASKFSTYAIGYTAETAKPSRPVVVIKPEEPPVWPFVDVAEGDWFYGGVKYVYEQGLMEGTSSSTFAPAMGTSRAMIATIIWRLAGSPETEAEPTYLDCVKDSWYAAAVAWGTEQGVVKGFSRSAFAPDQTITREQMAAMFWRYAGCVGLDTKADSKALNKFADGDSTGDWAVDSVAWCVESGILKGKGGNVLAPAADVTRAEAATMLERFIALLK